MITCTCFVPKTPHSRWSSIRTKGNIFNARLEEYLDISTDGTGIPVTITIDDPAFDRAVYDVKPGFTCNIRLASDIAPFIEEKLMNVPLSAVFGDSENKNTYVWVVKDNRVSRREVTVYSPTGEANLLISKGLKPDETVVIAGVYQLVEGQRVKRGGITAFPLSLHNFIIHYLYI